MIDGQSFVKITIWLRGWDDNREYTFYIQSQNLRDAEKKAWKLFEEHHLNGASPVKDWLMSSSISPFPINTYFSVEELDKVGT